jgi:hypothetical protein
MTHFDALLQQVTITYAGKSVQATVVDECKDCGAQDIGTCQNIGKWCSFHPLIFLSDMSLDAFQQLTGQTGGSVSGVTWAF